MLFRSFSRLKQTTNSKIRQRLGVLLLDGHRYWKALKGEKGSWVTICNRYERLLPAPNGVGVLCDWKWTSELHAPKVFPQIGRLLLRRALCDYPIILSDQPVEEALNESPWVSFIIGHRGISRLPHLLLTLQSIAAQRHITFECIVIEQAVSPEIKKALPAWVRYIHTPPPSSGMPYCRSWAFNVGARVARGKLLVFHDNDLLMPREYAAHLLATTGQGYQVVNLKRFIFYLKKQHSLNMLFCGAPFNEEPAEVIVQNAEGGGSIAIDRDSYFAIGGFDESFVGWGGEDNEFWDRAKTRLTWAYGYLPFIHLWHEAQPGKRAVDGNGLYTAELVESRAAISPEMRIEELRQRAFGDLSILSGSSKVRL